MTKDTQTYSMIPTDRGSYVRVGQRTLAELLQQYVLRHDLCYNSP